MKLSLFTATLILSGCSFINSQNDLSYSTSTMFPEKENMVKHIFNMTKVTNEKDKKIEFIVSKPMIVDCNNTSLNGSITEHSLEGWGYIYYQVNFSEDRETSTLINCSKDKENIERSVKIPTEELYPYNSKMPVVIYSPKDLDVKIRVWSPE
ncbi:ecotin family protein [Vibrio harveyi]